MAEQGAEPPTKAKPTEKELFRRRQNLTFKHQYATRMRKEIIGTFLAVGFFSIVMSVYVVGVHYHYSKQARIRKERELRSGANS